MLPCQQNCAAYQNGCHKECAAWRAYQAQQNEQRQKKKDYMRYYNRQCAAVVRQLRSMSVRRPIG